VGLVFVLDLVEHKRLWDMMTYLYGKHTILHPSISKLGIEMMHFFKSKYAAAPHCRCTMALVCNCLVLILQTKIWGKIV